MVKQQCPLYHKTTFSQTYRILGLVRTFEMAKLSLFMSQTGKLFCYLLFWLSVPKPQLYFLAFLAWAAHPVMGKLCLEHEWL